jgi:hypothetical protein
MPPESPQFTTWADLVRQLKNDLADQAYRRTMSYSIAGRSVAYRNLQDLLNLLAYAEQKAAIEQGLACGRTYAGNGGRG